MYDQTTKHVMVYGKGSVKTKSDKEFWSRLGIAIILIIMITCIIVAAASQGK